MAETAVKVSAAFSASAFIAGTACAVGVAAADTLLEEGPRKEAVMRAYTKGFVRSSVALMATLLTAAAFMAVKDGGASKEAVVTVAVVCAGTAVRKAWQVVDEAQH
eukprot:scaffold11.g4024.t1